MHRNGLVRTAAFAALACAGLVATARAGEAVSQSAPAPAASSALSLSQPVYLQDTARTPLMGLLDQAGIVGPLDEAKISLYGWVEGSYTHSFDGPPGNFITGRVFDVEHEDPTLNQLVLVAERTVDDALTKGQFDVGARVEWMWGGDARFIHSVGLFDHYGFGEGPDNQWDLTQAYFDVAVPVGNGLRVRAGKFVTPIGFEVINPTANYLYSHSFLFGYAIPFTHTGVLGTYKFSDELTVTGGITRGWDTSLEDNNDTIDFLGSASLTVSDKTTVTLSLVTGPDQPGNNDDWRTLVDLIVQHKLSDELTVALNADYAYEEDSVSSVDGSTAQWFGAAVYASYVVSPMVTVNARGEYFNDDDGARLTGAVGGTSVWEATLGLAITPLPEHQYGKNLVIRPEVRFDYANKGFFDAGTDHSQFTAAIDAIYKF